MYTFPENFVWGTATAAYQIEGAFRSGGRGPSIWDAYSHIPGKVVNNDNGDIACNHYELYEKDIALMKEMGLKSYRFSISWPRILPQGRGDINEEGITFYDNLINCLIDNGIQPWVTLFHWDMPLALQLELDGLLNPEIADHFAHYAQLCFERFGDRVKHWITLNEPWCNAMLGHGMGIKAPGRISTTEPYIAAHNLLRAHGKMVDIYRKQFQASQKGIIGITNNCDWREPKTEKPEDKAASQRALEFFLGWFADPIYLGDYPQSMKDRLGDRLPTLSEGDKTLIKDSSDFFGLNHYTTMLAEHTNDPSPQNNIRGNGGISADQAVLLSEDPAWEKTDMGWNVVPWGCRKILQWISDRYDNPPIYITENGCALPEENKSAAINDERRINFVKGYLRECHKAIENGVNLKGYFVWSFMDNFEWELGYDMRFGLFYVDYPSGERTPKKSALWYADTMKRNGIS